MKRRLPEREVVEEKYLGSKGHRENRNVSTSGRESN
jgi:hypothetical protein